jgi:peroxiredoxin
MKTKPVFSILLFLLIGTAFSRFTSGQDEIESYTKIGQKMPVFAITDTDGKSINIADLKDKVVLVNFWATWCMPCFAELPGLEKNIWLKFKSDDFVMVAIAREQSNQEIIAFKNRLNFTFPIAADPKREVYSLFGNGGIPRSYVVFDGNILYQSVGYNDEGIDEIKKVIETALKKIKKSKKEK